MSQAVKPRYILSPLFNKRLLLKDINNIKTAIPTKDASKELAIVPLTTQRTRIISPLLQFQESEKIQLLLKPLSHYKPLVLDTRLPNPEVKLDPLKFVDGVDSVRWMRRFEEENNVVLSPVERQSTFQINLNDPALERELLELVKENNLTLLESHLHLETQIIYILQNLTSESHDIFQRIVQYGTEKNIRILTPYVLEALLKVLSVREESFQAMNAYYLHELDQPVLIDDLISLCIKYDRLSSAKYYIDVLVQENYLFTDVEVYLTKLSDKLQSLSEPELRFNLLTEGFGKVYHNQMTPSMVQAIVPYVRNRIELHSLLKHIEASDKMSEIYSQSLNQLTAKYADLLTKANSSKKRRRAFLSTFFKHIKSVFPDFNKYIDPKLLHTFQ